MTHRSADVMFVLGEEESVVTNSAAACEQCADWQELNEEVYISMRARYSYCHRGKKK